MLIVVQLPRAMRRTLLLQKTRYLNEENLATNLARTLGSAQQKMGLPRLEKSALPATNVTTSKTVSTLTINKHLNSRRQTSM